MRECSSLRDVWWVACTRGENDRVSRLWFVALVSLAVSMSAQISAAQQWANRYFDPGDGERIPSCVRVLQDGGYIVAGQAIDTRIKVSSGWLMRLDSSGSKLWARTYSNQAQGKPSSAFTWAEQTSDGGFIACGWVHASNTEGSEGQGWMVKLNGSGEKQWSSEIGGKGAGQLRRVRVADDGGYIGVGSYSATVTVVGSDGWAVRIGRSGKLIWSATYGDDGDDQFLDVTATSDGGFVVVGSLTEVLGGNKGGWALGLTRTGRIRWQKTYEGSGDRELRAVSAQSDEGFVLAGNIGLTDLESIGWLLKTSPTGDVDWHRDYSPIDGFPLIFSAVQQAPDGDIVVAGRKPGGLKSETGGVAAGISPEGTLEWADLMGGPWLGSITALDLSQEWVVWVGEVTGYHRQPFSARDCLVLTTTRSGEACEDVVNPLKMRRSGTPSFVADSAVKRVTEMSATGLNTRVSPDPVAPAKYCRRPSLTQKLVLSRSPQSDGVTVRYDCTNAGRDTVPFKVQVFFSPGESYSPGSGSELVLEVDLKDGLMSGATSGPYYSINAKTNHRYAIAVIDPEGVVFDNALKDDNVLRMTLP